MASSLLICLSSISHLFPNNITEIPKNIIKELSRVDSIKKKFLNKKKIRPEKSPKKEKSEPKLKESEFYKDDNIDPDIKEEEKELGLEEIKDKMITSTSSPEIKNKNWINKTRILIVASRGVSHQERHLVNDLISLIPNSKKEYKIEKDIAREQLIEICYNHSCKYCLYFEHRKRELVMWIFRSPGGPLAKFSVTNIHALNEIKLIGNCIKYSRPLLSFDKNFLALYLCEYNYFHAKFLFFVIFVFLTLMLFLN